jgi:hypothetical protein
MISKGYCIFNRGAINDLENTACIQQINVIVLNAGKTESTKYVLHHLVHMSAETQSIQGTQQHPHGPRVHGSIVEKLEQVK